MKALTVVQTNSANIEENPDVAPPKANTTIYSCLGGQFACVPFRLDVGRVCFVPFLGLDATACTGLCLRLSLNAVYGKLSLGLPPRRENGTMGGGGS